MNILINVFLAIDMLVAVLMTLVILMQRPKSEGLGAAFGGGVTENIFGAQTTNVLTKFTGWLAGIFFVLTFVLGILYARRSASDSSLHRELMGMPAATPAASVAPATGSPGQHAGRECRERFAFCNRATFCARNWRHAATKCGSFPCGDRERVTAEIAVAATLWLEATGKMPVGPRASMAVLARASLMTLAIQVSSSREVGSRSATSSRNCNKTAIGL